MSRARVVLAAIAALVIAAAMGPAMSSAASPSGSHEIPKETGSLLINFVLDKSGSMGVRKQQTIAGFNRFLEDQQKAARDLQGHTWFSLTLFDTTFSHRYTAIPIESVPPLNAGTYSPGGSTALYDAIGSSVSQVDQMAQRPDKIMFVILTDGMENSSVHWTRGRIFDLIKEKRTQGWQFVFLGVDEDAYAASAGLGFARPSTLSYRSADSAKTYAALSRAATAWRTGHTSQVQLGQPAHHQSRSNQTTTGKLVRDSGSAAGWQVPVGLAAAGLVALCGIVLAARRRRSPAMTSAEQ